MHRLLELFGIFVIRVLNHKCRTKADTKMNHSMERACRFRVCAASNDTDGLLELLNDDDYCHAEGMEAVGLATHLQHNEVVYMILSRDGAMEHFKELPSNMFLVCTRLEASVEQYKKTGLITRV